MWKRFEKPDDDLDLGGDCTMCGDFIWGSLHVLSHSGAEIHHLAFVCLNVSRSACGRAEIEGFDSSNPGITPWVEKCVVRRQ